MEKIIEDAVKTLVKKSSETEKSDDAMRFAQAALNLEHVLATKTGTDHLTKGGGR